MKKFLFALLYVFVGLVSVGVWAFIGLYMIPFIGYVFKFSGFYIIPLILLVFYSFCMLLHFIILLSRKIKSKRKKMITSKFSFLLVYLVPITVNIILLFPIYFEFDGAKRIGFGDGYFYYEYDSYGGYEIYVLYDKFGKFVDSCFDFNKDEKFIYLYDKLGLYDDVECSIYDISSKEEILIRSDLRTDGYVFEESGMYGMALQSNDVIILPAIYESIEFHDYGHGKNWIKAKVNGYYGLMTPIGGPTDVGFCYEIINFDDNGYITAIKEDGSSDVFEFSPFTMGLSNVLSTKYEVVEICNNDRFIVRRDDPVYSYAVINKEGDVISAGSWFYKVRYDEESDVICAVDPDTYEEFYVELE